MNFLKEIPSPELLENLDFQKLLKELENTFKQCLNKEELELLESDNYKALLEVLAYRELILRARINEAIKSMLLPYASSNDLDNVVALYGIQRLKGSYPIAKVEFGLSEAKSTDTFIVKGLILKDDNEAVAILKDDVIIEKGSLTAIGTIQLQEYVKTSKAVCEFIQTPLPFMIKAKQLTSFSNGASIESDDRLRNRAVLSLQRFSTAGSLKSYIYHSLSASSKVQEVQVINGGAGVVKVYIKTPALDDETLKDVQDYLSTDKVRPLTDKVEVYYAKKIDVEVIATLELEDMHRSNEVNTNILNSAKELSLGVDLNLSYIYKVLHQNGVYRVKLENPLADIIVSPREFVSIKYTLNYIKAVL